jgi:hypothetical protein
MGNPYLNDWEAIYKRAFRVNLSGRMPGYFSSPRRRCIALKRDKIDELLTKWLNSVKILIDIGYQMIY